MPDKTEKLTPVRDKEKEEQVKGQTTDLKKLESELRVLYTKDTDATYDVKVIHLKYMKEGAKLKLTEQFDLNHFATIRNELGKDFYDNMLYKYKIPYAEIVALATALTQTKKYKEHDLAGVKSDTTQLVNLLKSMQSASEVVTGKEQQPTEKFGFELTSMFDKGNNKEQATKTNEFFENRLVAYKQEIKKAFQGTEMATDAFVDSFAPGVMDRWYGKVDQKISAYNLGQSDDKKASTDQIRQRITMSPFQPKDRKEMGAEDLAELLNNLKAKATSTTPITDLSKVSELMNFTSLQTFLANSDNYKKDAKLTLTVSETASSTTSHAETPEKLLTDKLQQVISKYESARPSTDIEKMVDGAMPILTALGEGIALAANQITELVDQLKKSGAREKLENMWNLFFGSDDVLTALSNFNKLKESQLSLEKLGAMNSGFALVKNKLPQVLTGSTQPDYVGVVKSLQENLFAQEVFHNPTTSARNKALVDKLGTTIYANLLASCGSEANAKDILDVTMRQMCGTDKADYLKFKEFRNNNNSAGAKEMFDAKLSATNKTLMDKANDEKRDFGTKPNETYVQALLATILDHPSAGKGIVASQKNTVATQIDSAEIERKPLYAIEMKVDQNKLMLDKLPSGKTIGYKIGDNTNVVEYTANTGIDLANAPAPVKISLVQQDADNKRSSTAKIDNIPVLQPTKTEVGSDNKLMTIGGLDAGSYLLQTTYKKDNASESKIDSECSVAAKDAEYKHFFDATKGAPTAVAIKPTKGTALWQTIWNAPAATPAPSA